MNDEPCDEEQSYNEWVKENLQYLQTNKQHIAVMKKVYMDGFAAGFVHRQKINVMEQLQK